MAQTAKAITTLEIGAESPFAIPVSLKRITSYQDVSLDSASPDGNPTSQKIVDLLTGDEVQREDVRRGVFVSKPKKSDKTTWSEFREISKDDLGVIEDATNIENFVIDHFVPLKDVPFERVTDAYFLAAAEGLSPKPLVLLARALKRTKRAGVFKLVKASRQYLAVVYEKDGGLIVNTLAYSDQFAAVREAGEVLDRSDVKISQAEVALASDLVNALAAEADVIDTFEDDLISLRADLVEQALKGDGLKRKSKKAAAAARTPDDDLEARLRETLDTSSAARRQRVRA